MPLPDWRDDKVGGTMIRSGLWLVHEIGEGNIFTKEQLREAFPGVSQVDRRVRDLRKYGWVILANTEDAHLLADEQRFVETGVHVWDKEARRKADQAMTVPATDRQAVFERDGYMCTVCGIGGGEPYVDDSNSTAVLAVARRRTLLPGGGDEIMLVTECKRCHTGARDKTTNASDVLAEIQSLDASDRRRLARWIDRGRRGSTPLDRAWNGYRRLPADAREQVQNALRT
ncbi:HNH endonuclease [Nocardia sp. IFM 10818]